MFWNIYIKYCQYDIFSPGLQPHRRWPKQTQSTTIPTTQHRKELSVQGSLAVFIPSQWVSLLSFTSPGCLWLRGLLYSGFELQSGIFAYILQTCLNRIRIQYLRKIGQGQTLHLLRVERGQNLELLQQACKVPLLSQYSINNFPTPQNTQNNGMIIQAPHSRTRNDLPLQSTG